MGYREVSVDRNIATETQTLNEDREGRNTGREPKQNDQTAKATRNSGNLPRIDGGPASEALR